MVGEEELVSLLCNTECFLGLGTRLVHLYFLTHVVLLRLRGHLTMVVALGGVWLIKSVDYKLTLIIDGAQLTATRALFRLRKVHEANVFGNWYGILWDEVEPIVLLESSLVLGLFLLELE